MIVELVTTGGNLYWINFIYNLEWSASVGSVASD
jgi:hypothetical protein